MPNNMPYMPLYPGDFWREPGCRGMTNEALGAYVRLWFTLYDSDGEISGTDNYIRRICGAEPDEWARVWGEIQMAKVVDISVTPNVTCNAEVTDRDKIITVRQRRIAREVNKRKKNALRQSRFRGKQKVTPIVTGRNATSSSSVSVSSSKKKDLSAQFDLFWKAYPKKKSKGRAEKAFVKIKPDEQLLAAMLATIERAKKSKDWTKDNGKWIPYPATWLNAKGWLDEYFVDVTGGTGSEPNKYAGIAKR